jgi:lysophospholipase L1-like esterase
LRILCIGDSITKGTGGTEGNRYPEVMARLLEQYENKVVVVNKGVPGSSTRDYWELIQTDKEWIVDQGISNYDGVIIMLGTNDCRLDNWVESLDTEIFLTKIVTQVQTTVKNNKNVFICSILPLADPMPSDILGAGHGWRQGRIENEINPIIRQLSKNMGISFIDVYSEFKSSLDSGNVLYDGIHPYDIGYELIGNTIGKAIFDSYFFSNQI